VGRNYVTYVMRDSLVVKARLQAGRSRVRDLMRWNFKFTKFCAWGWQPCRHLWADCLDNVGSLTSYNSIGPRGLWRRQLFYIIRFHRNPSNGSEVNGRANGLPDGQIWSSMCNWVLLHAVEKTCNKYRVLLQKRRCPIYWRYCGTWKFFAIFTTFPWITKAWVDFFNVLKIFWPEIKSPP
jgi:hypothetical protein